MSRIDDKEVLNDKKHPAFCTTTGLILLFCAVYVAMILIRVYHKPSFTLISETDLQSSSKCARKTVCELLKHRAVVTQVDLAYIERTCTNGYISAGFSKIKLPPVFSSPKEEEKWKNLESAKQIKSDFVYGNEQKYVMCLDE